MKRFRDNRPSEEEVHREFTNSMTLIIQQYTHLLLQNAPSMPFSQHSVSTPMASPNSPGLLSLNSNKLPPSRPLLPMANNLSTVSGT
jgi:hypothetical protein